MNLNKRIEAFAQLGKFLKQFSSLEFEKNEGVLHNDLFFDSFANTISQAQHKNGWFLPEQVVFAIAQWAAALEQNNLEKWLNNYQITTSESKIVGIVMAGNIPLVGFHDLLCVLLAGHHAQIKMPSNSDQLLIVICDYLKTVYYGFKEAITFTNAKLTNFDAVIATGSNNTARYFEYYFKNKPNIIRKNRNSVALLTGKESAEELESLGDDIFRYYGLGCRSVSKLYVPKNYDFDTFFQAMYAYKDILKHEKFVNNYDYNKAVYLMSNFKLLDNGFLILKEDTSFSSPIATLFYETYENLEQLKAKLNAEADKLQCVVNLPNNTKHVDFGKTQQPHLQDYADGIDTIDFLLKI